MKPTRSFSPSRKSRRRVEQDWNGRRRRAGAPVATLAKRSFALLIFTAVPLLRLVRLLFAWKAAAPAPALTRKVVVIRWDAKLGDAIVSSFLYRELRKVPGTQVTVVTTLDLAGLHRDAFQADEVVVTKPRPGWIALALLALRLRGADAVVHLVRTIRPPELFFLWLLGPGHVYSLDDSLQCVGGVKLGHATEGLSFADKYAFVLRHMGVADIDSTPILPRTLAEAVPPEGTAMWIAFNPYASRPDKSLSTDKAVHTLACLADALPGRRIRVLSSPSTHSHAIQLTARVGRGNVEAVEGVSTVEDMIEALTTCGAVVTVDTGIVHVATALGRRMVAIYPFLEGAHNPWLPPASDRVRIVYVPQNASRYRRTGIKDMDSFDEGEVLRNLQQLLATVT